MFQRHRFQAAGAAFDDVAEKYAKVNGVVGGGVRKAPDQARMNPAGPQYVIFVDDRKEVEKQRHSGKLPTTVSTPYDTIEVVLVDAVAQEQEAHTSDDNPMRPGSSICDARDDAGTLGALLDSPGTGDTIVTCGHIFPNSAVDDPVFQAGPFDANRAGRPPRQVGKVLTSGYPSKTYDVAVARIDTKFQVSRVPYDGVPAPSLATPAVGMVRGIVNGVSFFMHIDDVLKKAGDLLKTGGNSATLRSTLRITENDDGREILASGRTSGLIKARVEFIGFMNTNGIKTDGFFVSPQGVTLCGDSGAVAVTVTDMTAQITEDGGIIDVSVQDTDPSEEYLPGIDMGLDELINSDGSDVEAQGVMVNGKDLVARILAKLSGIGKLKITVDTQAYRNTCVEKRPPSIRATPVKEVILRKDREAEIPDVAFDPIELDTKSTCCTFGTAPYVVISSENGDKVEARDLKVEVSGVGTLNISVEVSQNITGAKFSRFGNCFRNICQREEMRGTVYAERSYDIRFSISAGEITLPGLGKIKAGGGEIKIKTTEALKKRFVIPCQS
ncbi:hypothetical protein [uncultured Roseibium sp.]|uniref:hypothetical protein n=1 Tax=uncultured Roseibium sp. TaxID=1936171 RepID=UPI002628822F|nr:hypothetical protein [uncultured Roseibium sp.]